MFQSHQYSQIVIAVNGNANIPIQFKDQLTNRYATTPATKN